MTYLKKKFMSNVKIVPENYIKFAFYITQAFGVVGKLLSQQFRYPSPKYENGL